MGLFGKWRSPKRQVAIWDPALLMFDIKWLVAKNYNVVEDTFLKKAYEIGPDVRSITFKLKGKIIARVPVVDEPRGVGVNIEYGNKMLEINTNPDLLGHMIDATMIKNAYALSPSMKSVIIAGVIAFLLGLLFGNGMSG
jgi:hypothetical protein